MRALLLLGLPLVVLTGCPKKPDVTDPGVATTDGGAPADGAAPAAAQPMSADDVHQQVDKAAAWLTTKDPQQAQKAIELLQRLSAEAPDIAEIPYNMGVAYEILGDETEARKRYLRATDIDPSLGEAWLNMGAIAERHGDLDRALQAYRAGLRSDPDNGDLVVGLISVLRKQGQHEEAIREARAALGKNANNINIYNNLGLVYIDQGNLDLALFIYQKAQNEIIGAKENPVLLANLGRVYMLQDRDFEAREQLEKALQLDPDLVSTRLILAQFYMDNHNWQSTIDVLQPALKIEPNNAAIHMNMGIGYRGLGRYEEAKRSYEKALQLDPSNPDPHLNLAVLLGDHMKAFDAALDQIDQYQQKGGSRTALANEWKASILEQKDKYDRAQARKKRQDEQRKQREERERLLEEQKKREAQEADQPEDAPAPVPDGGAAPAPSDSPWGSGTPGERSATMEEILQAAEAGGTVGAGAACNGLGTCGSSALECAHDGICRDKGTEGTFLLGIGCFADTDCAYGLACLQQQCTDPKAQPAPAPEGGGASPWGN